ncbi:hypothetical protein B0H14DRAFT_2623306 [Mycena olivaceomarginata]|nr:hypothetical protein B0H14DRAFT_2623306 [Mycena olivaceomarginata]
MSARQRRSLGEPRFPIHTDVPTLVARAVRTPFDSTPGIFDVVKSLILPPADIAYHFMIRPLIGMQLPSVVEFESPLEGTIRLQTVCHVSFPVKVKLIRGLCVAAHPGSHAFSMSRSECTLWIPTSQEILLQTTRLQPGEDAEQFPDCNAWAKLNLAGDRVESRLFGRLSRSPSLAGHTAQLEIHSRY